MMNRIILIGNGFDLAHGLKTSYKDFIEDYWIQWVDKFQECHDKVVKDALVSWTIASDSLALTSGTTWSDYMAICVKPKSCIRKETIDSIRQNKDDFRVVMSPYFETINKAISTYGWVDIENEYYKWLKKIALNPTPSYEAQLLDKELIAIKTYLIDYLKMVEKSVGSHSVNSSIREAIYEPIQVKDISRNDWCNFEQALIVRVEQIETIFKGIARNYIGRSDFANYEYQNIVSYLQDLNLEHPSVGSNKKSLPTNINTEQHIRNIKNNNHSVPKSFLWPDQILFLNFNYTNTADLYVSKSSEFKVNHIHGELGNDKNPIIFGYGDELDDDYKEISKLNDNDYLKNIKSIRYLETDNYRKLLSFIDSAPFQIYIMGHSCGNSDRTLLNTLFEHKNCVSIKPFYYEKPDGTDNYIEIIQNISRNFNSMQLMRDRVVNKTYCRPLVPQGK